MKALLVVICLLAGASLLSAETTPAAPAKPGTKAKTEAKKEDEPVIPGLTIVRNNGTFLGLEIVNGNFKLSFYDAKKKPMAVDVSHANIRWPNKRTATGPNFSVLNLSGNALVGNKFVQPPYVFTAFLNLIQGDGDDDAKGVESYSVPFNN